MSGLYAVMRIFARHLPSASIKSTIIFLWILNMVLLVYYTMATGLSTRCQAEHQSDISMSIALREWVPFIVINGATSVCIIVMLYAGVFRDYSFFPHTLLVVATMWCLVVTGMSCAHYTMLTMLVYLQLSPHCCGICNIGYPTTQIGTLFCVACVYFIAHRMENRARTHDT